MPRKKEFAGSRRLKGTSLRALEFALVREAEGAGGILYNTQDPKTREKIVWLYNHGFLERNREYERNWGRGGEVYRATVKGRAWYNAQLGHIHGIT